jgi:hypothetical protein
MNKDTKFFGLSITMIGAFILTIPPLAALFGFNFSNEDAIFVNTQIDAICTAIGSLMVIIGRIRANNNLTVLPKFLSGGE